MCSCLRGPAAGPLPEAEDIVDLFSLVALLDDEECAQGPEFLETRIRELVPLGSLDNQVRCLWPCALQAGGRQFDPAWLHFLKGSPT